MLLCETNVIEVGSCVIGSLVNNGNGTHTFYPGDGSDITFNTSYLASASFDSSTRLVTLTMSDSTEYSYTIPCQSLTTLTTSEFANNESPTTGEVNTYLSGLVTPPICGSTLVYSTPNGDYYVWTVNGDNTATLIEQNTVTNLLSSHELLGQHTALDITNNAEIGGQLLVNDFVHIQGASVGQSANINADNLVIEADGNTGITIFSGPTNDGNIFFGDSGGNDRGIFRYDHQEDAFKIIAGGGSVAVSIDNSAVTIDKDLFATGDVEITGAILANSSLRVQGAAPQLELYDNDHPQEWQIRSSANHLYIEPNNENGDIVFRNYANQPAMRIYNSSLAASVFGDFTANGEAFLMDRLSINTTGGASSQRLLIHANDTGTTEGMIIARDHDSTNKYELYITGSGNSYSVMRNSAGDPRIYLHSGVGTASYFAGPLEARNGLDVTGDLTVTGEASLGSGALTVDDITSNVTLDGDLKYVAGGSTGGFAAGGSHGEHPNVGKSILIGNNVSGVEGLISDGVNDASGVVIGDGTLHRSRLPLYGTFIGKNAAGISTLSGGIWGNYSTVIGAWAGYAADITASTQVTIFGGRAGYNMQSGNGSVLFGYQAGLDLDSSNSIGIGTNALYQTSGGNYNIAVGHTALGNYTGLQGYTVGIGSSAGQDSSGSYNVFMGHASGQRNPSAYTIGIGYVALEQTDPLTTNNPYGAVMIGGYAGRDSDPYFGVGIGYEALRDAFGQRVVAIGVEAGEASNSNYSVYLGGTAGKNSSGDRAVYLGYGQGENSTNINELLIGAFPSVSVIEGYMHTTAMSQWLKFHADVTVDYDLTVDGEASLGDGMLIADPIANTVDINATTFTFSTTGSNTANVYSVFTNNAIRNTLTLQGQSSSGDITAGFGQGIKFELIDQDGLDKESLYLNAVHISDNQNELSFWQDSLKIGAFSKTANGYHLSVGLDNNTVPDTTLMVRRHTGGAGNERNVFSYAFDLTVAATDNTTGVGSYQIETAGVGAADSQDVAKFKWSWPTIDHPTRLGKLWWEVGHSAGTSEALTIEATSTTNSIVSVADDFAIVSPTVPANATDTGTTGQIAWDGSYIYVCTAANTWVRAALATW